MTRTPKRNVWLVEGHSVDAQDLALSVVSTDLEHLFAGRVGQSNLADVGLPGHTSRPLAVDEEVDDLDQRVDDQGLYLDSSAEQFAVTRGWAARCGSSPASAFTDVASTSWRESSWAAAGAWAAMASDKASAAGSGVLEAWARIGAVILTRPISFRGLLDPRQRHRAPELQPAPGDPDLGFDRPLREAGRCSTSGRAGVAGPLRSVRRPARSARPTSACCRGSSRWKRRPSRLFGDTPESLAVAANGGSAGCAPGASCPAR